MVNWFLLKWKGSNDFKFLLFAAMLLIIVGLIYFFSFGPSVIYSDQEKFGQFGDFFGGVLNPLLTFLTVYLLVKEMSSASKRNEDHEDREERRDRFAKILYQKNIFDRDMQNVEKQLLEIKVNGHVGISALFEFNFIKEQELKTNNGPTADQIKYIHIVGSCVALLNYTFYGVLDRYVASLKNKLDPEEVASYKDSYNVFRLTYPKFALENFNDTYNYYFSKKLEPTSARSFFYLHQFVVENKRYPKADNLEELERLLELCNTKSNKQNEAETDSLNL